MADTEFEAPIVHVSVMGNLANQMIQYMLALSLASRVGRCIISNVGLHDWNIVHPPVEGDFTTEIATAAAPDLDRLAEALAGGTLQRVDVRTYGQRMENFLTPDYYRKVFVHSGREVRGTGPDELLCNIRQGDILDGHHPDYVLIPLISTRKLPAPPACAWCSAARSKTAPTWTICAGGCRTRASCLRAAR